MNLLTVSAFFVVFATSNVFCDEYEFECPPGMIIEKIQNNDGKLEASCMKLDCENMNGASLVCNGGYRRSCFPGNEFLVGFKRKEADVMGKYGRFSTKHIYLSKCCSHPLLSVNFAGTFQQDLSPEQDFFQSSNNYYTGNYVTKLAKKPSHIDHYTVDILNLRCKEEDLENPPPPRGGGAFAGGSNPAPAVDPAPVEPAPVEPAPVEPPPVEQAPEQPPAETRVEGLDEDAQENTGSEEQRPQEPSCNGVTNTQLFKQRSELINEGKGVQLVQPDPEDPEPMPLCQGSKGKWACETRCKTVFGAKYVQSTCFSTPGNCENQNCVCIFHDETIEHDISPEDESYLQSVAGAYCFSGDNAVETRRGFTQMSDLRVGDEVLTSAAGSKTFQKIVSFIHREPETKAKFIEISTEDGSKISLTPKHLIPIIKGCQRNPELTLEDAFKNEALFAEKIALGDCLVSPDNQLQKVTQVKIVSKVGIYSPITENGQMVIENLSASCFSHYENHFLQLSLFKAFMWVTELATSVFGNSPLVVNVPNWAYVFTQAVSV